MEKYFELLDKIENEKINIVKLYLLSSINMAGKNKKEEWAMVNYCYNLWIDIDVDIDLSRLADIVCWNWEEIKTNKKTNQDIIEMCLNY